MVHLIFSAFEFCDCAVLPCSLVFLLFLQEFRWVFEKFDYKDVNLLGEPFDRKSIMMYEMDTLGKVI